MGTARTGRASGGRGSRASRAVVVAWCLGCLVLEGACGWAAPVGSTSPDQTARPGSGCGGASASGDPLAPSPGCTTPGATETPWPVSQAQAVAAADAFTGLSDLAITGAWGSVGGPAPVYILADATRTVVVDGTSGAVVEVFEAAPDILPGPDGQPPSWSPAPTFPPQGPGGGRDAAVAAAAQFLSAHGLSITGASASAVLDSLGTAAWVVSWTDSAAAATFEVTVDAGSGRPVAFVDRRSGRTFLAVPRVGRDAAVAIAIAKANADKGRADEQLISVEMDISILPGGQANRWQVALGVPGPDASSGGTIWRFGTAIDVDASTGAIAVVK